MANVLFTRTSDPNSKPVTDGQLIFDTSGNGKMYLDNGTNRLEMGGALTVDATLSKTSTNPVQNKAVAGVMLDTLSDIGTVTSKGFLTDALAVKELNTNVNELNNSIENKIGLPDYNNRISVVSANTQKGSFTATDNGILYLSYNIKDGYMGIRINDNDVGTVLIACGTSYYVINFVTFILSKGDTITWEGNNGTTLVIANSSFFPFK